MSARRGIGNVVLDGVKKWLLRRRVKALGFMPDIASTGFHSMLVASVRLKILDQCDGKWATTSEIAAACDIKAVDVLDAMLKIMSHLGFIETKRGSWRTTRKARPLIDNESLRAWILFRHEEVGWWRSFADFLRTNESKDFHHKMSSQEWDIYQDAFRHQSFLGEAVAKHVTLSPDATTILDIGGASGANVKPLLKRFPRLHATIIELPQVVERMDGRTNGGEWSGRITYVAADAREVDLGPASYDLVMMTFLLHHLKHAEIERIVSQAADSLRPGGTLAVGSQFSRRRGGSIEDDIGWFGFMLYSGARTYFLEDFCDLVARKGLSPPRKLNPLPLYLARKHVPAGGGDVGEEH